jgi:predicted metal-dependent phosphoesterase TrpH
VKLLYKAKVDLHIHSNNSIDSKLTIEDILEYYEYKGFKAIAITDHDEFKGSIIANKISVEKGLNLKVLFGAEIETAIGEVILITTTPPPRKMPKSIGEIIDTAKDYHGLTIAPHPYAQDRRGLGDNLINGEARGVDVIEVWNGKTGREWNEMALNTAKILGKPGIANSDAHNKEDLGIAYTIIEVNEIEPYEIIKSLKNNRILRIIRGGD